MKTSASTFFSFSVRSLALSPNFAHLLLLLCKLSNRIIVFSADNYCTYFILWFLSITTALFFLWLTFKNILARYSNELLIFMRVGIYFCPVMSNFSVQIFQFKQSLVENAAVKVIRRDLSKIFVFYINKMAPWILVSPPWHFRSWLDWPIYPNYLLNQKHWRFIILIYLYVK